MIRYERAEESDEPEPYAAAAKVTTALVRLEGGNLSKVRSVGGGVHEIKIDFGPGYRVYFGFSGIEIVILLAGGTKKSQNKDIGTAKKRWTDYKARKNGRNIEGI